MLYSSPSRERDLALDYLAAAAVFRRHAARATVPGLRAIHAAAARDRIAAARAWFGLSWAAGCRLPG